MFTRVSKFTSLVAPQKTQRSFTRGFADSKLVFTFATPQQTFFSKKEILQVKVPGISGEFGILAEHVPTVAELKPGVVSVFHLEEGKEKEDKYFVCGGFAMIYKDSQCTVSTPEAAPLDNFDAEAAREGLKKHNANLAKAVNDEERAKAMIGVELHQALCSALGVVA